MHISFRNAARATAFPLLCLFAMVFLNCGESETPQTPAPPPTWSRRRRPTRIRTAMVSIRLKVAARGRLSVLPSLLPHTLPPSRTNPYADFGGRRSVGSWNPAKAPGSFDARVVRSPQHRRWPPG